MVEWSNDCILLFLELYEAEPTLWNPKHRLNKDKVALKEAWLRISASINMPVAELKKKKESLMAAYRKHARKKRELIASGAGEDDIYQPSWFAYSFMARFLQPVFETERNIKTERNEKNRTETERIEEEQSDENSVNVTRDVATPQSNGLQESRRRRSQNPPGLQEANSNMKRAFTTLNNVLSKRKEDDDCDLFSKLIANRLRKIPEQEREDIMYEMHRLLHERTRFRHTSIQYVQSPSSSPIPTSIIPAPQSPSHQD